MNTEYAMPLTRQAARATYRPTYWNDAIASIAARFQQETITLSGRQFVSDGETCRGIRAGQAVACTFLASNENAEALCIVSLHAATTAGSEYAIVDTPCPACSYLQTLCTTLAPIARAVHDAAPKYGFGDTIGDTMPAPEGYSFGDAIALLFLLVEADTPTLCDYHNRPNGDATLTVYPATPIRWERFTPEQAAAFTALL